MTLAVWALIVLISSWATAFGTHFVFNFFR